MSAPVVKRVEMVTEIATYTITEIVGDDGRVEFAFETSNPPRGLNSELYKWNGSLKALGHR